MNQTDTQRMLEGTIRLRGSIEETRDLIARIEASRAHISQIADDLMYRVEVLRQRTDLQSHALELLEQALRVSRNAELDQST